MTNTNYLSALVATMFLTLAFAACQQSSLTTHKLVVTGNQHSVPMYTDEQSYLKVSHMNQQGGLEGMAGKINKDLQTRSIDDQTQVKVVSSDDNGAVVEITDGPMKGQTGFVAKQNLD